MSARAMAPPTPLAVAFGQLAGLKPGPGRVLMVLARAADLDDRGWREWGRCWLAVNTIAVRAGVSECSARRYLSQLVTGGLLERADRPGRSCLFTVVRKAVDERLAEPVQQLLEPTGTEGAVEATPVPDRGLNLIPRGLNLIPDLSVLPAEVLPPAAATQQLPPQPPDEQRPQAGPFRGRRRKLLDAPEDMRDLGAALQQRGLRASAKMAAADVPKVRAAIARVGVPAMVRAAASAHEVHARLHGPALTWRAWVDLWDGLQAPPPRPAPPPPEPVDTGTSRKDGVDPAVIRATLAAARDARRDAREVTP